MNTTVKIQFLLALLSLIIFSIGTGIVPLFDWDEINFAESAREMIVSGNYLTVQINYEPFWEKPPLFIWMQVLSMKLFGINEFSARFPNAVAGVATVLVLFNIGVRMRNIRFGLLWVLTYVGSLLPFFYFKSGIIDPWFNLFIFLGLYYFIKYQHHSGKSVLNTLLSALFIGLGILTKGPVALLLFLLSIGVYGVYKKFKIHLPLKDMLIFTIALSFVGGFWFILQIMSGNFSIIQDFIHYQIELFSTTVATHGGFFGYHFVVLLIGMFPASILALRHFKTIPEDDEKINDFNLWMKILFWVVIILFSIVKTKIVHYSSMCYFPLSYLAANVLYKIHTKEISWHNGFNIGLAFIGVVLGVLVFGLSMVESVKEQLLASGIIHDKFAEGNLQATVHWPYAISFIGVFMAVLSIAAAVFSTERFGYKGLPLIFFTTLAFTFTTMMFVVPRIEQYSQHAAIAFYKQKSSENCYVETLGFKSYADLYYFKKQPPAHENENNEKWLLTGEIDKPAYFVSKNTSADRYTKAYPELKKLYKKNGFVFFVRQPIDNTRK